MRRVFGLIPVPVFYTDRLPRRADGGAFDGYSLGPVILIRPASRTDDPVHAHELEHARQWWMTLGLHWLLYPLSRRYRLWAERRAYDAQLAASPEADRERLRALFAAHLATWYGLAEREEE